MCIPGSKEGIFFPSIYKNLLSAYFMLWPVVGDRDKKIKKPQSSPLRGSHLSGGNRSWNGQW